MIRVILVEDNPLNAELATDLLELGGHSVTLATSAAAFRKLLAQPPGDIVLMDIRLPDGDGVALLSDLRSTEGWHAVPVVAMTAHALIGDRQRFLETGFTDVVTKPIETRTFRSHVEQLCRRA